MKTIIIAAIVLALSIISQIEAAIIRIPHDRPTIQMGVDLAQTGDTVLVAPGHHYGAVNFRNLGVHVISEGGPLVTFVHGSVQIEDVSSSQAELSGFYFGGSTYGFIVVVNNASPVISDNIFANNSGGDAIIICTGGSPTIRKNLFHHNVVGSACVGAASGVVKIINNTFDTNSRGFFSLVAETVALNNIVTNSESYGIFGEFQTLDYNDVWSNGVDYEYAESGPHDISLDPLYVLSNSDDYTLQDVSPCIDTGNPDPSFLDPDGTIADMGARPTNSEFPRAVQIRIGSAINQRVPEALPLVTWSFRDTLGLSQYAYELQFGSDRDWAISELWATGEVISPDTSVQFAGPAMDEGQSYWGRIRVNNGVNWGPWTEFGFQLNQTPQAPNPIFPIQGETLASTSASLRVADGVDLDSDSLTYVFEVYSDADLSQPVATVGARRALQGITFSEWIPGLLNAQQYWWRARVSDGYESSEWTAAHNFLTRSVALFRVPQDFATIQAALDSSQGGDTILVAPGTYRELLVVPDHDIKLISELGPEFTRLARPLASDTHTPTISFLGPSTRECEVSGFMLADEEAGSFVNFDGGSEAVLRDNVFRNLTSETAIIFTHEGNPLITRNVFSHNLTGWYCVEALGPVDIINNTFNHNSRGVYSHDQDAIFLNNIVSNSMTYGIHGSFKLHDYNDIWNNNPDYTDTWAAAHEISIDPDYVDEEGGDLQLNPTSPCVDSGDPRPEFNDPDGSRSDIGAISTDFDFPLAMAIAVGESGNLHVVEDTPFITWQYYNLGESWQTRLEIEIGTDPKWDVAELWATGPIYSTTASIFYDGPALLPGQFYYGRIRLKDGLNWGGWRDFSFRRNSQPPVPIPISPINYTPSPWTDTRLVVSRCSDPDLDTVLYQFVVYSDSALNEVVTVVDAQADTLSESILGLVPLQTYWWAARSFDGYESSSWTPTQHFRTRDGIVYEVPEAYPTIQHAIDAAHHGDTVLVAPGTYSESLNLKGKCVTIKSSGGSDVTTIVQEAGSWVGFWPSRTESNSGIIGFTLRDHNGDFCILVLAGASPTIEDLRFIDNSVEIVIYVESGGPLIRRNLFYHNTVGSACIGVSEGATRIENNTFESNGRGIFSFSAQTVVRNNILTNSSYYGLYGKYGLIDYNLMWRNGPDYVEVTPPATHELVENPMFVDTLNLNFSLAPGSPCIDAGDPSAIYNDPDGTRNDVGAYRFTKHYPGHFSLISPADGQSPVILTLTPSFEWNRTQAAGALGQLTYTLQIAADSLFAFSGFVTGLDTNCATLPTPLSWGTRYWWRVRASIAGEGDTWSDEVFTFRTHKLGDADGSGRLNITDIVFIINYIFLGGRPPDPLVTGDVNCSGRINIGDAVYLVNYIFGDGPQPCSDFPATAPALGSDEAVPDR